jgi:hypothetical protein
MSVMLYLDLDLVLYVICSAGFTTDFQQCFPLVCVSMELCAVGFLTGWSWGEGTISTGSVVSWTTSGCYKVSNKVNKGVLDKLLFTPHSCLDEEEGPDLTLSCVECESAGLLLP